MTNACRRSVSPASEHLLAQAVRSQEMSAAALQPPSIVDPQVMPRRLRIAPRPTTLLALAALILFASPPAEGQQADPEPVNQSATLQELERLIESQRRLIEAQGRRIDELQRQIDEMRNVAATPQGAPPAPAAGAPTETGPKIQWPELPPDIVSAGDFPGSFKIPGTDAAVRIGGMVRVNWVTTFDPLLTSDSFITSDIPVDVANAPVGGRVDVIAFPSRFNLDFRTPTGVGYLRAYVEGDFSGSSNTLSLRHAFGQWRHFLFGQTWSTFSDPEAVPDGIDFEGLNAAVHFRQPQVRWTWAAFERVRVAIALENADTELADATGANQRPDFVSRIRWEPERGGHIQVAGLFRQLRGFPSNVPADLVGAQGWGVNASGRLPSFFWSTRDLVLFQVTRGAGIGHYIKDLNADGGQDGVFDSTTNAIRVLPALAGYASYEHWWKDQLHSALTAGVVNVTTLDIQPGSALQRTDRYSANIIWSPIPRLELVTEMLYGIRVNRDLHRESALQLQIGSTFRF
jgi:outer membrane DcaP-like protein